MRAIDRLGEIVDIAPQNLIDIIEKLSRKILKLREAGFRSVVLGADHGFLYLRKEPERMPCKGELVKWRFAVNKSAGNFVAKTDTFGINGDLLRGFPAGTSIFAVQGEAPEFVHGGLSLQETVKVTWLSGLKEAPEEVELKVVDHDTGEVLSKCKAKVSLLM